jgi:itaconyl-CoA hydratase
MTFYAYGRRPDGKYQERFGLDFEDFAPGQRFAHRPGVTLSQQDNVDEALDTMNAAMLHYDAHYAAQTTWKKPLMVSTITLQRAIGMASKTFGRRKSLLGFSEIALTHPVFGGDTLYASSEILICEATDDPDTGIVEALTRAKLPDGTEVARFSHRSTIYKRGRGPNGDFPPPLAEPRFAAWREAEDGVLVEQVGLYFEEFRKEETFVHYPRRSFYWDESVEHAWRSLELNPRYHDLDWLRQHAGGRLQIGETFLITAATAPTTRTFGRVVANLGWYDIALPRPVYAGDTIEAESTVLDSRSSKSRPNEGILSVETRVFNQRGEEVLSYRRNLLVYRKGSESPYAKAGY